MKAAPLPSTQDLQRWLQPFAGEVSAELAGKLMRYLDLLLRWNSRTNLTAVREPREIVERHFGESLFAARLVPSSARTLLDVGSGAGFPGLPIALARPNLHVTLAESQGKKAAFLQEAVRTLQTGGKVCPKRVEFLPETARFDVVTLRAVDRSELALEAARQRVKAGGALLHLTTGEPLDGEALRIPGSEQRVIRVTRVEDPVFHVEH